MWVCGACGVFNLGMTAIAWSLREPRPAHSDAPIFSRELIDWRMLALGCSSELHAWVDFETEGAMATDPDADAETKADAFDRAIALANTPAEAAHIRQHLDQLDRKRA